MPPRQVITTEDIYRAGRKGRIRVTAGAIVTDAARELAVSREVRLGVGAESRTPRLVMANWKMNQPPVGVEEYARRVGTADWAGPPMLVIFPPDLLLDRLGQGLPGQRVELGVQRIHPEPSGAFTGESSGQMARDLGARWCLAGHSERRRLAGDTDGRVAAQVGAAGRLGLRPVLCIGESERERQAGRTLGILRRQILDGLVELPDPIQAGLVLAYEPIWAIGTGQRPDPTDIARVHAWLRSILERRWGPAARALPILYGGSVTPESAAGIMAAGEVDGFLVGGAGLDPMSLLRIGRACRPRLEEDHENRHR